MRDNDPRLCLTFGLRKYHPQQHCFDRMPYIICSVSSTVVSSLEGCAMRPSADGGFEVFLTSPAWTDNIYQEQGFVRCDAEHAIALDDNREDICM